MNGYSYTNGGHGIEPYTDREYCQWQYEMYRAGEVEAWSAKRECELSGYHIDLRNGQLTPIR